MEDRIATTANVWYRALRRNIPRASVLCLMAVLILLVLSLACKDEDVDFVDPHIMPTIRDLTANPSTISAGGKAGISFTISEAYPPAVCVGAVLSDGAGGTVYPEVAMEAINSVSFQSKHKTDARVTIKVTNVVRGGKCADPKDVSRANEWTDSETVIVKVR